MDFLGSIFHFFSRDTLIRMVLFCVFVMCFSLSYVFIPDGFSVVLKEKTPDFLPWGLDLVDIFSIGIAILMALIMYGLIRGISVLHTHAKKLTPGKIAKIYQTLSKVDKRVLETYAMDEIGLHLILDNPDEKQSILKLKKLGLLNNDPFSSSKLPDDVAYYVYEQIKKKKR